MAKRKRWLEIPTELSLERFREFVLPHLTVRSRGPAPKLSFHALFNYILKLLYLGCQWKELPIERDEKGRREVHHTSVYRVFRRWEADGSLQAVSLLVQAASSFFAVPLAVRIHEGLVWSNRDRRTLLDKMLALLGIASVEQPFYFVADAYYAAHKIVAGLLKQNNHLLTRMKSNAVAYTAYQQRGPRKRGRPRVYRSKIKLSSLWQASSDFQPAPSPVYGENKVIIQYRVRDLLWRPAGRLVRFVAVIHPTRGACLLMCTDTSLDAIDIIRLYGLRFKIEHTFKQAVRQIGSFTYHFWMSNMKPLRRNSGNQHLHRTSLEYRSDVERKLHAYHVFIQAGIICQGLLQYLAFAHPRLVWNSFGSWLRTIRPGIPPSELVVAIALRQSLPEFLLNSPQSSIYAKFVTERQDTNKMQAFRLAA